MDNQFALGTPVCYKCGSPTFVVIGDGGKNNKITLAWFNPTHLANETFTVDRYAIETIENFNDRKKRVELAYNNRLYEIPAGIAPETIVTLGFVNAEHKSRFLERMLSESFEGQLIGEDKPDSVN